MAVFNRKVLLSFSKIKHAISQGIHWSEGFRVYAGKVELPSCECHTSQINSNSEGILILCPRQLSNCWKFILEFRDFDGLKRGIENWFFLLIWVYYCNFTSLSRISAIYNSIDSMSEMQEKWILKQTSSISRLDCY